MKNVELIIILVFSLMIGFPGLNAQDKKIDHLPIGAEAPDFQLPGVDGKYYSLADFSTSKGLVVVFICNHCPTAQAYEDKLMALVSQYKPKGIGFVAISPNDPDAISLAELGYTDLSDGLEEMKIRAKEMNYNFPYLFDGANQQVSIQYGPSATPHAFLLDGQRKLIYSGRIDDTENPYLKPKTTDLKNAIEDFLAGRPVRNSVTKTFGCSIKWSWKGDWVQKQEQQWSEEAVTLDQIDLAGVKELVQNKGDNLRLINFWATWCGPCVVEYPDFIEINRMYRGRDFEFISVSADKVNRQDKALEFLKKKEASNKNYLYAGDNIYDLIEVVDPEWQGALPYTMLIASGGEVVYKTDGSIDPYELKKAIIKELGRYYAND